MIEFGKSLCESMLEYNLIMEKDERDKEEIRNRMIERKLHRKPDIPKLQLHLKNEEGNFTMANNQA